MTETIIVGVGVDTFIANVKQVDTHGKPTNAQDLPVALEASLQEWQELARAQRRPFITSHVFNDTPLLTMMGGSSTWKYVMRNNWVEIKLGARLHMGMLAKIRLSSEYLWGQPSLDLAIGRAHQFLSRFFGGRVYLQAGQVDLCVDVAGLHLPSLWEEVFITHALGKRPIGESSKDRAYYGGRKLETLQFSGHGNPMSAKLYNKVKEIQQHSPDKIWFHDLWKRRGWDEKTIVWRQEFSIERAGLRDMIIQHRCASPDDPQEQHHHCQRIDSAYDIPRNLKRLWTYCTCDWLRMVTPAATRNRHRWATTPAWALMQHAFDDHARKETEDFGPIIRKRKREKNLEQATAAIAGYASTYAAWDETTTLDDDISVVFSKLYEGVTQRLDERGIDFTSKMVEKRNLYSVPKSDQEAI